MSSNIASKSYTDLLVGLTDPINSDNALPKHKRSRVWGIIGITNPVDVVTCYAKYIPVHGLMVTGVLTIAPTRVIFEPNLDDPEVTKDGLLAHQFSVETGRLMEVELFTDEAKFRARLAKQLEEQAPWDLHNMGNDNIDPKLTKKFKKVSKNALPVEESIHFDAATEEMLQIVCRGRYRPKNYANFVLPKDKADSIYHRMVRFLSGSNEERVKAYLNLDVCAPSKPKPKLRREHSFSVGRSSDRGFADIIDNLQTKRRQSRAPELASRAETPSFLRRDRKERREKTEKFDKSDKAKLDKLMEKLEKKVKKDKEKKDKQDKPEKQEKPDKEKQDKLDKEKQDKQDKLQVKQDKLDKEKQDKLDKEKLDKDKKGKDKQDKQEKKNKDKQDKQEKQDQEGKRKPVEEPGADSNNKPKPIKEAKKEKKKEGGEKLSFSERWRARKGSNAGDTLPRPPLGSGASPPASPKASSSTPPALVPLPSSPLSSPPSSTPTSPTMVVPDIDVIPVPEFDLNDDNSFVLMNTSQPPEDEDDLPMMMDESLIFTEKHMHQLRRHLPGYTKWMDWKLLYCTETHGISFSTFLHNTKNVSPTLFVIEDSNGFVFGGFATSPWAINSGYFGTGQSFLFSLKPKLHVYEWTRANSFFMLLSHDAVAMGGDKDGRFGFWLDSNFEFGSSEVCATYFNRCLASTERFKCTVVEVWTFTDTKHSF